MSDLLTKDEIKQYMLLLDNLPEDSPQVDKVWALLKNHKRALCRESFMPFVKEMWPSFIGGKHHKIMADAFERVANGDLKRLIINMPPRHTKSEFASYLFPAWFLGRFPEKKIIQTAHTAELAVGFGRKVRNLVGSSDYQAVFPTKLSADSKAAGRWNTNKGGDYFAIGVGGAVTGKGADVLIIDDPHSEQEAMQGNPNVYDRVYEWYSSGPRQRLQPGGSIVVVMTRWGKRDLTGQVTQNSLNRDGDEWEIIELPALLPSGKPLWPEFWKQEELEAIRAEIPLASGRPSTSRTRPLKRGRLSNGTCGGSGRRTKRPAAITLSSPGIPPLRKTTGRIIQPAPPGGCFTKPTTRASTTPI
jgi:hypothetical protein